VTYFERLWSEIPDVGPEHFERRRDFLLSALAPGCRVLDVGCGSGWFCQALDAAGFDAVGVDVAAEAIRRARERSPELEFQLSGEGGELPFLAASFDAAWLGEVLEHVQDGLGLLAAVERVLAPGGLLVVSTPDHRRALRLWLGLSARAFERHFEPRSDHVRFFTRRSLRNLLEGAGFEAVAVRARRGQLLASCRTRWPTRGLDDRL
jgi:2-polyprenyl-6-hydroxyphenyl methylase/3-demethylubiquinone-9 3-methyltransferase